MQKQSELVESESKLRDLIVMRRERAELQGERKHMTVKQKVAMDKSNFELELWALDSLPQEVTKDALKAVCRELGLSDISDIQPALIKLKAVVGTVPRMEKFITKVRHPAFEDLDPPSLLLHLALPSFHKSLLPSPYLCCAVLSFNCFHSAYLQSHPYVTSRILILRSARCNMLHVTFEQICIFLFQNDEVRDRRRRGDNEVKQGARQGQGQVQDQDPLPPQLSMEHVMPLLQRSVSQSCDAWHRLPGWFHIHVFSSISFCQTRHKMIENSLS